MALTENFDKGFVLLSRSVFESDIWCLKPPEYAKLWIYLIGKAAYTNRQYGGFKLKRGQCFCSSAELEKQISYNVGWRKAGKSASTAKRILKFLRETGRITTTSAPRGVLITLLSYDQYQVSTNYERTNERTTRAPRANQKQPSINKKDKTVKNDKYVETRDKVVKHLFSYEGIQNPEGFMLSVERKYPQEAVWKGMKDWCGPSGISSPSGFVERVKFHAGKQQKQESDTATVAEDFLTQTADAES